jgi:SSS family solute:Na+ symporter
MSWGLLFFVIFLFLNALFIFYSQKQENPDHFVLQNRRIRGLPLFFTLLASNLSAFTVLGVSGAAYRIGWAFFPPMATGTALMAFSFLVLGIPLRVLSAKKGWRTPGQCIADRYKSPLLGKMVTIFLLLFTLPYLAVQISSAGTLINTVLSLPPWGGALIFTLIVTLYVVRGGMTSIVKTDIFQGLVLIVVGCGAFGVVLLGLLRNPQAMHAYLHDLEVFNRQGIATSMPLLQLLSYYFLWFLADPLFPHFTQRFYSARSPRSLLLSMPLYPLAVGTVFFMMTALGVWGRALLPGLSLVESEKIYILVLQSLTGDAWFPLFMVAALAALISTFDSQLLSCASMITEEFFPGSSKKGNIRSYQIVILGISILAYVVSLYPPKTLLSFLTGAAFSGYAVLAPVLLGALYWPSIGKKGGALVLAIGVTLVAVQQMGVFRFPLPAPLFNVLVQSLVLVGCLMISKIYGKKKSPENRYDALKDLGGISLLEGRSHGWVIPLSGILLLFLSLDWWFFGAKSSVWGIVPNWIWYHLVLLGVMTGVYGLYLRMFKTP